MTIIVDLCIVPVGAEVSLSKYIAACEKEIKKSGLDYELFPNGTAIKGDWDEVFNVIKICHNIVHDMGVPRIHTNIKIGSRIDKDQSILDKISSVKAYIE